MKKNDRLSNYFNLKKSQWDLDFVDVFVAKDVPLFIDPWAIKSGKDDFSAQCHSDLQIFFTELLKMVKTDRNLAIDLLDNLHEPKETHLGFSSKNFSGRGIGRLNSIEIYEALKDSEAVKTGLLTDLEDTALYVEYFGPDKISDIVTNVIKRRLIEYTEQQQILYRIPTKATSFSGVWHSEEKDFIDINNTQTIVIEKLGKLLLVPKGFVRKNNLHINYTDFYSSALIEFEQARHLDARDSLCRTLKSGALKEPTKKSLMKKIPASRALVLRYIRENPQLLVEYKKEKSNEKFAYIPNKKIVDSIKSKDVKFQTVDISPQSKIDELKNIKPGDADAYKYHDLILNILNSLYYPFLQNPKKEDPINEERKKIDISYRNTAAKGFFNDLAKRNIVSAKIFFECKNYSSDIKNPAFDQMLGRFDFRTATIGFIVCRTIDDKEKMIKTCNDAVVSQQKYIVVLTDEDLEYLLEQRKNKDVEYEIALNNFMTTKLEQILNV